jgi:opacity protein-like surface antigen
MKRVMLAAAFVAFAATTVQAQAVDKRFSVTTRLGTVTPERSSSLDLAGLVGLDTEYSLNKYFGTGVSVDVTRGNTHREDFVARLRYGNANGAGGDTIYYQYVGQPVNTIHLGAFGVARYPTKRVTPFVMGGVGTYTMLLDTQINGKAARKNSSSFTLGAGLWIKFTENSGIQIDARQLTMRNFDRKFIDPTAGRNPNTVFPEDFPAVPAAKNTAGNLMLSLGFRYIPRTAGGN